MSKIINLNQYAENKFIKSLRTVDDIDTKIWYKEMENIEDAKKKGKQK